MKVCNKVLALDVAFLEDKGQFEFWYSQMPEYRQKKIDRYKPEGSKRQSLGAGILLSYGLKSYGCPNAFISQDANAKPHIEGADDLEFNISHSDKMVICAFSDAPVGVDVEKIKVFDDKLVNYVYEPKEINYIKKCSKAPNDESLLYTKLWTMKESVMKYYGKGLSMDPRSIFIDVENGCKVYHEGKLLENIFLTEYEHEDFCITVCSEYKSFSDNIIYIMGE